MLGMYRNVLYLFLCVDDDRQCGFEIVHVGETVTIKCSITNPQQDGVYMYRRYKK